MAFQLEQLLKQVEGSVACSVMGYDGIPVVTEQAREPGLDLAAMLVEYGGVLQKLKEAAARLEAGTVSEMTIVTEKLCTITRTLTPEYYLVMAVGPDGNVGKGRYVLRIAAPKIKAEL